MKPNDDKIRDFINEIENEGSSEINPKVEQKDGKIIFYDKKREVSKITKESTDSIKSVYDEFNRIYGLDLQIDFTSVHSIFQSIVSPDNKRIFEIYLSEVYSRFKLTNYQNIMIIITNLINQVSDPTVLLSDDVSIQDKFVMLEKLFDYLERINRIDADLEVPKTDVELKRIKKEGESVEEDSGITDEQRVEALKLLKDTVFRDREDPKEDIKNK